MARALAYDLVRKTYKFDRAAATGAGGNGDGARARRRGAGALP
jgi:hypothetical protein